MSTDQTTPPPASATLAGVRGTAEPAEAADAAAGVELAGTESAGSDPIAGPADDLAARSAGDHAAGPITAGSGGEQAVSGDRSGVATPGAAGDRSAGAASDQPGVAAVGAAADGDRSGVASPDPVISAGEPARQPVGSSWQAEASGQLVAMSFPGARRIAGWLFWVVFPLLCIVAIQTSVSNVADHLGKKPTGIRGSFVVQPRSCSQGFCSFGGLFTSDDHTIKNLPLLGDPRWHTADVLRVTYDPRSVEVTALPGHWDPTPSVMAAIGALTYLVLLGYFVREQRRAGRSWRRLASSA
jgi:hypothetical protein